jgi:hypothetical protein
LDGFHTLKRSDQESIRAALFSGPSLSHTKMVTSPKSSPVSSMKQTLPEVRSSPKPSTLRHELSELWLQSQRSNDAAITAKIACLVFKHSKEARDMARFNPEGALLTMTTLALFFAGVSKESAMVGLGETIARASGQVVVMARPNNDTKALLSALESWSSGVRHTGANACWQEAKELAALKMKSSNNQSSHQHWRELTSESPL